MNLEWSWFHQRCPKANFEAAHIADTTALTSQGFSYSDTALYPMADQRYNQRPQSHTSLNLERLSTCAAEEETADVSLPPKVECSSTWRQHWCIPIKGASPKHWPFKLSDLYLLRSCPPVISSSSRAPHHKVSLYPLVPPLPCPSPTSLTPCLPHPIVFLLLSSTSLSHLHPLSLLLPPPPAPPPPPPPSSGTAAPHIPASHFCHPRIPP